MTSHTGAWRVPNDTARELRSGRQLPAYAKPLSILLADDYESNRILLQAQLEQLGYQADAVANGEEVLRALRARSYDVVLLDIGMPIMSGLETARRIRGGTTGLRPFIVAVTADTSLHNRRQTVRARIDAFIEKPLELGTLAAVLDEAYARQVGRAAESSHEPLTADSAGVDLGPLRSRLGRTAEVVLSRVIPAYLRELPGRESRMRAAFEACDLDAVARLCHGLKGASRVVGATELATTCDRLEQGAYEGTLPEASEIKALLDLARRTGIELRRELACLDA